MSKTVIFLLAGILIGGAVLRAYNFWLPSLWLDELGTYWVTQGVDLKSVVVRAFPQAPLYHLLAKASQALLGAHEFALRLPAVLFGVGSIYLVFLLGRQLFSQTIGLMSATLLAVNIYQILFSREARPYSMAVFFALLATLFLLRYLEHGRTKDRWVYCISAALVVYAHYIFLPLLLVQSVYWLHRRILSKSVPVSLKSWFATQLVILLLIAPLIIRVLFSFQNRGALNYVQPPTFGQLHHDLNSIANLTELLVVLLIALILLPLLDEKHRKLIGQVSLNVGGLAFLVFWLLLPILFKFVLSKAASFSVFQVSYLLVYLPAAIILQAYILALPNRMGHKVVLFACFAVLYCLHYMPLLAKFSLPYPAGREDWRGAIYELNSRSQNGDLVLLRPGFVEADLLPFTTDTRLIEALHASVSDIYLRKSPRIILLTHTWDPTKFGVYYDTQIKPQALRVDKFWVLDPGYHADVYLPRFDNWLKQCSNESYALVFQKHFGIVSLRLYTKRS